MQGLIDRHDLVATLGSRGREAGDDHLGGRRTTQALAAVDLVPFT